jgi:light-regulated signal transduction histidine kinase (bacteriophytochrome)
VSNSLVERLVEAEEKVRVLQTELAETNRGLVALMIELEQRVEERTKEVQEAHAELQKTNSEVMRATLELQTVNSELEAFSYSVSHDLRAPLRAIDGFGKMLIEDCADQLNEEGKRYVRQMGESVRRMSKLIDDMLALARVTRAEMRKETVDLSALARKIAAELRQTDPKRDVQLVVAEGLVARADAGLLRAVLENLLANAWKFTGKVPRARIEFGCTGNPPTYFVRDNGAGFDMTYASKLFGAFQRLHTEQQFPGTGIGLAIVHRIIQRHGGRVWAEGEVEKGATFCFTL